MAGVNGHDHNPPPARRYPIAREKLAIVDAIDIIGRACRGARVLEPGQQSAHFRNEILRLLPADARSDGERWEPGDGASADDWARLGAYLGAIDGWTNPKGLNRTRDLVGPNALAYLSAYTLGKWEAWRASTVHAWQHTPAKGQVGNG